MATSDILGLFMSPEQYQAQQMAQQQAADQQRAFSFAQLSPRNQAVYGMFLGGQQLGRGLGGLLGVQDPQLQRIRQREQIMQSINPADMNSLTAGIQRASQMGDQELALTLTDFMNKQGSEMALAQQRKAQAERERTQAVPAGLQEAARIAEIERTLVDLPKDSTEYLALTAEKNRLERSARSAVSTDDERKATAYANSVSADSDSKEWKDAFGNALNRLIFGKEGAEKTTDAIVNATALANATGNPKDSIEWKNEFNTQLKRLTTKEIADKYSPEAQKLIDAGYIPGSPSFISKMDEIISKDLSAKQDKGVSFGTDREAIAQEFFELPFKDLTKDQKAKVNSVKEEREGTVAQKGAAKFVLPGQEKPVDVLSFRISARKAVEPYIDTIDNGDNALAALKNARTSDGKTNESSFNQGVAYLAAMAQSGRLSNKDVELVKESPAVLRSLANYVSTKWEGVPTQPTINGIIDTVRIIRKVAKAKYDREIAAQRKLADLSGIPPAQRDTLFEDMTPSGGGEAAAKPENKKTVPFNALPKK
jgi:hypothetical protein